MLLSILWYHHSKSRSRRIKT